MPSSISSRPTHSPRQRLAGEEHAVLPAHHPVLSDLAGHQVTGVLDRRQRFRIWTRRWTIDRGRAFLPGRLVRPLVVVCVTELVEALLLAVHRLVRWTRRFGFECAMHSLVCAVLFGVAGHDALDLDAQPNPPQRQRRKSCQAGRSERTAVVRQDRPRQSVLAEDALEGTACVRPLARWIRPAGEQVAAVAVRQSWLRNSSAATAAPLRLRHAEPATQLSVRSVSPPE